MIKITFWHEPGYFQFYIQDPIADGNDLCSSKISKEMQRQRFGCGVGIVCVHVISEYSEIPITVQYDGDELELEDFSNWDRIIECPLTTQSKKIVFAGCPDGPRYGCFGTLEIPPGSYRLRIYYGGQNTQQMDGETEDFYLVQIWPSNESDIKILKP